VTEKTPVIGQDFDASAVAVAEADETGWVQRTFWSLRHRDYRLLWFGSLFSSAALWIQQTTISWLTFQITGSEFMLGAVNGIRAIPLLFLAPFGGVAADRFDRKKLMFFTQMYLMGVTAAFGTVVLLDYAEVWNIVLFSILTGIGWALTMPVRQSVVPAVVPREDLQNAIALNSAGFNMTRIVGPSAGGLLIATIGMYGNFYLQAAMYLGVAAMVWQLTLAGREEGDTRQRTVGGSLVAGARYVWANRELRVQMAVALLPVLLALPYISLMPALADEVLGAKARGFGFLMSAPGIGAVAGTLAVASMGNIQRRGLVILLCLVGLGVSLVGLAWSEWYSVSFVLLMFTGAFQMLYMSQNQTILQLKTPAAYRGRVMGIFMLNQGLIPLGSLFAGTLAEFKGTPFAIAVMGGSLLALSLLALALLKDFRRA
jgi:MFS family permease